MIFYFKPIKSCFFKACDGRRYGKNCSAICGNCIEFEQCNPINGTCMNGCDKGFEGLDCTKGRVEF